ncbi:MAG: putative transporter ATP-binding protein [Chloroflexi bacterium]|nr:putative transporter ATP-binding protein [Chloroflexota bacterium]
MSTSTVSTALTEPVAVTAGTILSVRDLWVEYRAERGMVQAVRGVSFDLRKGESLALIGESGSGKTTLAVALIRLLTKTARVPQGTVTYWRNGRKVDVLALGAEDLRRFRWKECAMVFQSALNSLNPVLKVWDQMYDTVRYHESMSKDAAWQRSLEVLQMVQLDAARVLNSYPHELSGGMRQRVLLAMGLLLNPQVLLLDEPTTALDILTQRSIINLLRQLKATLGFSTIFISHDLSLAAELADRVATMYAGQVVELGEVRDIFYRPRHPYTLGLLQAVPSLTAGESEMVSIPGSPPDLIDLPSGCKFHPRCTYAIEQCRAEEPALLTVGPQHGAACLRWAQVAQDREHVETQRA